MLPHLLLVIVVAVDLLVLLLGPLDPGGELVLVRGRHHLRRHLDGEITAGRPDFLLHHLTLNYQNFYVYRLQKNQKGGHSVRTLFPNDSFDTSL